MLRDGIQKIMQGPGHAGQPGRRDRDRPGHLAQSRSAASNRSPARRLTDVRTRRLWIALFPAPALGLMGGVHAAGGGGAGATACSTGTRSTAGAFVGLKHFSG